MVPYHNLSWYGIEAHPLHFVIYISPGDIAWLLPLSTVGHPLLM